jgi:hypothetical protein
MSFDLTPKLSTVHFAPTERGFLRAYVSINMSLRWSETLPVVSLPS